MSDFGTCDRQGIAELKTCFQALTSNPQLVTRNRYPQQNQIYEQQS